MPHGVEMWRVLQGGDEPLEAAAGGSYAGDGGSAGGAEGDAYTLGDMLVRSPL